MDINAILLLPAVCITAAISGIVGYNTGESSAQPLIEKLRRNLDSANHKMRMMNLELSRLDQKLSEAAAEKEELDSRLREQIRLNMIRFGSED